MKAGAFLGVERLEARDALSVMAAEPWASHTVTFSFANLDGGLPGLAPAVTHGLALRALSLWADACDVTFVEVPDSGPAFPADAVFQEYAAEGHPQIRLGVTALGFQVLGNAYFPGDGGLAGDISFTDGITWGELHFLEVATHEIGHGGIGLGHELQALAVMNPSSRGRFAGSLFEDDVRGAVTQYGPGHGKVIPLPYTPPALTATLEGGRLELRSPSRLIDSFAPFLGWGGAVVLTTGDVTGDGAADFIVNAGPGGNTHVKVYDGTTGRLLHSFFAFDGFQGDLHVAAGGTTIAFAAGPGGNSHVKVFDGRTGGLLDSLYAFPGWNGDVLLLQAVDRKLRVAATPSYTHEKLIVDGLVVESLIH